MPLISFQRGDVAQASGLIQDWKRNDLEIEAKRQQMGLIGQQTQLNEINLNKARREEKLTQEQDAWMQGTTNIKFLPIWKNLTEEGQNRFMEMGQEWGYTDAQGNGTRGNITRGLTTILGDKGQIEFLKDDMTKSTLTKIDALDKEINELVKNPNAKSQQTIQILEKQKQNIILRHEAAQGNFSKILDFHAKQGQGLEKISDTQLYSILENSTDPAERKRAADMLEFRRAQAPEVYSTTGAREKAVTEYAQPKAYETKIGTEKADFASKFPQQRNLIETLNQQWNLVDTNIGEAEKLVGLHTVGYGSWLKYLPATDAKLLDAKLEMIRSNIGFDTLREMRAQSPTGGALGQVSEWENKLTQAVKGVLDQSLSGKDLRKTLGDIRIALKNLRQTKNNAFQKDYGTFLNQTGGQTTSPKTADEYLKKFGGQ